MVVWVKPEKVSPVVHEVAIRSQDGVKMTLQDLADVGASQDGQVVVQQVPYLMDPLSLREIVHR